MLASAVSARPVVRAFLLKVQRDLGRQKAAVFEGRDMGTVVFPEADAKFFLDASPKVRAQRRFSEIAAKSGTSIEAVERDMELRDRQDRTRALAPLQAAADAVTIDATALSVEQVVERMLAHVQTLRGRP
jgi:cytidylate kinase